VRYNLPSKERHRYHMDEASDASGLIMKNTAAQILTNQRGNNGIPASPASAGRLSRNSLAASRLLRARKDRRQKTQSPKQPCFVVDDKSIASVDTLPTSLRRSVVDVLRVDNGPATPPLSPISASSLKSETSLSDSAPQTGTPGPASPKRAIRTRRERVAGGAAAKLLGSPVQVEDDKYGNSHDDTLTEEQLQKLAAASQELDDVRKQARDEFRLGPQENSRYRGDTEIDNFDTRTSVMSDASVPSILNRSEIFHENATAAILALLTPRSPGGHGDDKMSVVSGMSCVARDFQVTSGATGITVSNVMPIVGSPFASPQINTDNASVVSGISAFMESSHPAMPISPSRAPKPLLSNIAERQLENIQERMKDPNKQLSELLTAIASPNDENVQPMDRGYMVRRKNACGALKVLTTNEANRLRICWTVGVLPALTSLLEDTGRSFVDVYTRREYVEARIRAVASLLNLCIPKENRLPIFHSAGLVQAVISVIEDDHGEARQGCCGILAYLSKTNENRLLMVQIPGLLDAVASVVKPVIVKKSKSKKKFLWDHSDESSVSSEEMERNETITSEESDKFMTITSMASSPRHTDDDDSDSDTMPQRTTSPTSPSWSIAEQYDRSPNTFMRGSRQNVFAMLLHVIKEKDNAFAIARHSIVHVLVEIAELQEASCHVHAVKILAHLTRHRENSKWIVFSLRVVVPCFVQASSSDNEEARKFACCALQNLSQDKACRQEVASTKGLVLVMCQRARQATDPDEKLAAISALKNLTDEPANLIPMSNTPECFATIMQLAHGGDETVTEMMQYLACDALATWSHWLRKIATSGQAMDRPNKKRTKLFVPTLKPVVWNQWQ